MAGPQGPSDKRLRWIVALAMVAVFFATRYWRDADQAKPERPRATAPEDVTPSAPNSPTAKAPRESRPPSSANTKTYLDGATAKNVVLRDVEGRTVFRGDVDLQPTLDRIDSGRRLDRFNNDGTVFQNREGRLPRKPTGYYREWVHPTPETPGPGPQRIVSGRDGDRWYTPDHYAHFYRIQP